MQLKIVYRPNNISFREIAKRLAYNHYNISISESNIEDKRNAKLPGNTTVIFSKYNFPKKISDLYFQRNILVIGAGATTGSYSFIGTASSIIKLVQEQLGLTHLMEDKENVKIVLGKYISLAEELSFLDIPLNTTFENLNALLSFEEKMILLCHYFTEEKVAAQISALTNNSASKRIPPYRFLPSLFYEVVAHLFKHRYIDIIINLNFDELLDNAIEDAMGESTYHKIVDDGNCKPFEEIVDSKRLRIPIYIKPHGTVSSINSLRFTNKHYLGISKSLDKLLDDIFSGKVGQRGKIIKRFNIFFTGYSLSDFDIRSVLFRHFTNKKIAATDCYYFEMGAKRKIEKFNDLFEKWVVKKGLSLNREIRIYPIECKSDHTKNETNDSRSLGRYFLKIYDEIRKSFIPPFQPQELIRHQILSILFPRPFFNDPNNTYPTDKYFSQRAKFIILFELIKYKGVIPVNVFTSDRASKYQIEFLKLKRRGSPKLGQNKVLDEINLISFLKDEFGASIRKDKAYIVYDKLDKIDENNTNEINVEVRYIVSKMVKICSVIDSPNSCAKAVDEIMKLLTSKIGKHKTVNSRSNEINAIYNDPKHNRFYPFEQENIINTNLELTWQFYHFATDPNLWKQWDTLIVIDDSGKSLFNLYNYAETSNCYLSNIAKDKSLYFIHSIEKPIMAYDRKKRQYVNVLDKITDAFSNRPGAMKCEPNSNDSNMHKMALFLKINNVSKKIEPRFGIYFFKPNSKVKVNPVSFYNVGNKMSSNWARNLAIMFKLFIEAIPDNIAKDPNKNQLWPILQFDVDSNIDVY